MKEYNKDNDELTVNTLGVYKKTLVLVTEAFFYECRLLQKLQNKNRSFTIYFGQIPPRNST